MMWKSIKAYGRNAILLEWIQDIDYKTNQEILTLAKKIEYSKIHGIVDVVPAYASLTIFYMPEIIAFTQLKKQITLIEGKHSYNFQHTGKVWEIDVLYHKKEQKDLVAISQYSGLSTDEIIEIHSSTEYSVYFIGFLPGFLYLGGLSEKLCVPRKSIPDLHIPAGSVAIGGAQTGIYPQESPGGWYVIGHTDFKVIDFNTLPFCKVMPGDKVKFKAIW